MRKAVIVFCALSMTSCAVQYTKLPRYIRPDWTTVGGAFWNKPNGIGTDIVAYTLDYCTQDEKECHELASGSMASETVVEQVLSAFANSIPTMYGLENIPSDSLTLSNSSSAGSEAMSNQSFNHFIHMGGMPVD